MECVTLTEAVILMTLLGAAVILAVAIGNQFIQREALEEDATRKGPSEPSYDEAMSKLRTKWLLQDIHRENKYLARKVKRYVRRREMNDADNEVYVSTFDTIKMRYQDIDGHVCVVKNYMLELRAIPFNESYAIVISDITVEGLKYKFKGAVDEFLEWREALADKYYD